MGVATVESVQGVWHLPFLHVVVLKRLFVEKHVGKAKFCGQITGCIEGFFVGLEENNVSTFAEPECGVQGLR